MHNTSPSWAPPPHLTLNKHPLHYPSFAQDRKKKVRYIQASLRITLPGPRGTNFHSRSEHPPERRGRRRQPERCSPSPARLEGGTCTKEAPVPWSISAPPLSSCKREEAAWEPGAAGGGQRGRAGCSVCSVQSQQLFVVESQRSTRRGQRRRRLLSNPFPRLRACNPPSLCPHG